MPERVGKASNETINKTYAECKQRKLNERCEKIGKASNYPVFYQNFSGS